MEDDAGRRQSALLDSEAEEKDEVTGGKRAAAEARLSVELGHDGKGRGDIEGWNDEDRKGEEESRGVEGEKGAMSG